MQTFDGSNINQISKEYQDLLDEKKLAIGQVISFRFLSGKLNPDPEERRKREILWVESDCIVGRDRIRDPFNNKLVDIAVVKSVENNGNITPEKLHVPLRDTNGFITIVGGNVAQERWYEFLLISNKNESNPYRDKNIQPVYKLIDDVADSKEKNRQFDLLTDMLQLVKTLSKSEKQELASAYGWDRNSPEGVISQRLKEIVVKDPEGFSKVAGNKNDLSIKAIINDAIVEGVITHSPLENKYTFTKTGEVICSLARMESAEPREQLLEWLKTSSSGKAVIKNIKIQLKSPTTD